MVMKGEFRKQLGKIIDVKKANLVISGAHIGSADINLITDPNIKFSTKIASHFSNYSVLLRFHLSWEKQVFSLAELEGRSRMIEEGVDFGKRNPV